MSQKIYFTAGPSALYFTVEEHMKAALKKQIPSISHRSTEFQNIYRKAAGNIRELLDLPEDYYILFLGSATEAWERILQNCVEKSSCHLVNGAFSNKFAETSEALGFKTDIIKAKAGECSKPSDILISNESELIALTHNETSTGVMQPVKDIKVIREAFPDVLLAIDVVSSAPYINFDPALVDCMFFSVQKGMGLPAGLGVFIINRRCLEKSINKKENGHSIGFYHSLPSLVESSLKYQTPETPNVLGIHLLAEVTDDMNQKGRDAIFKETEQKAAVIYQALEDSPYLEPFVSEKECRSKTTIVAEMQEGINSAQLIQFLKESNMVISSGYGEFKEKHIRIANFPTHSREQIEMLADKIQEFKPSND